jgi:hypothetical protein
MDDYFESEDLKGVLLSQREVKLLLRYTAPFDEVEDQLKSFESVPGSHILRIDTMDISMLIGDLVNSAKSIRSDRVLEEFDALCDVLEAAEEGLSRVYLV